jgi:hypothetical protein
MPADVCVFELTLELLGALEFEFAGEVTAAGAEET